MRHDLVLCTWPDGSSLVRFLAEDAEELWSGRVEREVNAVEKKNKTKRSPFSFRSDRRLFLFNPLGSVDAALTVNFWGENEEPDTAIFDVVFPPWKSIPSSHVSMDLWGLFLLLQEVPALSNRASTPTGEEDVFLGFCLPWFERTPSSEPWSWRAERWVSEKARTGYLGESTSSNFARVIDNAQILTPSGAVRLRTPWFEIGRRHRRRTELGSELKWSVDNFVVGCRSVDQEDLATALVQTGVVFWDEDQLFQFVRKNANIPQVSEVVSLELMLGNVPSWFTLSRKELRESVDAL